MLATIPRRPAVAIYPKNSGLAEQVARQRERGVAPTGAAPYTVRGEDVPLFASEMARLGNGVTAFTGDDLLDEWLEAGNALDAGLRRRRIAWCDPNAIYGAPALCLIGRDAGVLREPRPLRIVICRHYRRLTERYLRGFESDGVRLEIIAVQGGLENYLLGGIADLFVDIVVTGRTIRDAGLSVLRVFSTSDLAVLETA